MAQESDNTREIVTRLQTSFENVFGSADRLVVVRAPGRVNLIGDHTDYNDGFVLPITIDRDAYVAVRARSDGEVVLYSSHYNEQIRYPLQERRTVEAGSWTSYVSGAIEELVVRGDLTAGVEMLVDGDVPIGAGLSSSAALEVAVVHALDVLFGMKLDPVEAIRLCQTVEHRYAGVDCGIMDQFVSRLGRAGSALLLDCRSLQYELVSFSPSTDGLALAIADSGVTRELATSKYGERRAECQRALAVLKEAYPDVHSLRDVTPDMAAARRGDMDDPLYDRVRHVLDENARVLRGAAALRDGLFDHFGELMNQSHASLRDRFEVSSAELDTLVTAAQQTEGVLGARMTGGGFGGCTITLVRVKAVEMLREALRVAFMEAHGRSPRIFVLERNHQIETLSDGRSRHDHHARAR